MHYATKDTVGKRNRCLYKYSSIDLKHLIFSDSTVGKETEDSCLELFTRYYKSMTSWYIILYEVSYSPNTSTIQVFIC